MNPKNNAAAGTLESSDVFITIVPADDLRVEVNSIVQKQWGSQIEKLVKAILSEVGFSQGLVTVKDKGARECTIRARLKTALRRSGET